MKDKIANHIKAIKDQLAPHELDVLRYIWSKGPVTQSDIAANSANLGSHPRFENYANHPETTLRFVRQIIRDLKVTHGVFICSSTSGYWIPTNEDEARLFLDRVKAQAKAAARSYMVTVAALNKTFGLSEQGDLWEA